MNTISMATEAFSDKFLPSPFIVSVGHNGEIIKVYYKNKLPPDVVSTFQGYKVEYIKSGIIRPC